MPLEAPVITAVRIAVDLSCCPRVADPGVTTHQKNLYGRRTMRHFPLAICLLVVIAAITGCGGSSGSSSSSSDSSSDPSSSTGSTQVTSGESPTKSEFIAQADDICKTIKEEAAPLEARFQQLSEKAKSSSEFKQLADLLRELVGYSAKGVDQIQELEPPVADQGAVDAYTTTIDSRVSTGKEFADALDAGAQEQVSTLSKQASALTSKAEQMAKTYGFKVCGAGK
jgi:hypothetical protein